jgi:hypothetical protein
MVVDMIKRFADEKWISKKKKRPDQGAGAFVQNHARRSPQHRMPPRWIRRQQQAMEVKTFCMCVNSNPQKIKKPTEREGSLAESTVTVTHAI